MLLVCKKIIQINFRKILDLKLNNRGFLIPLISAWLNLYRSYRVLRGYE